MKRFFRNAALGVATLLLAAGCLPLGQQYVEKGQMDQVQDEIQRLKRSVSDLNTSLASRPAPDASVAPRLAQLGERVEQLDRETQSAKGKIEEMERSVSTLGQSAQAKDGATAAVTPLRVELKDLAIRVDAMSRRLSELSAKVDGLAAAQAAATASAAAPAAPAPAAPATPAATVSPRDLYDSAYSLYREGKLAESQEKFRDYIQRYPNTQLTDNAYFWIGEAFYDQGKHEQAILQYDKVVQSFPDSDKLASALLKQAFSFAAMGDPQDARILLKKVISEYPNSEQAPIAKKKLEILGN